MGVEGIWGGTSWISLRSVHFLEVYIKPKKKKKKTRRKVHKGLPTLYSDEDINSDVVVLINGKFPQTQLYRPQSSDVREMGLTPI